MKELANVQVKILEELKFLGIDVNLFISLSEYRIIYSEKLKLAVIMLNDMFAVEEYSEEEINNAVEEMPDAFFTFIGKMPEKYKDESLVTKLHDLLSYGSPLFDTAEFIYHDINDVFSNLKSIYVDRYIKKVQLTKEYVDKIIDNAKEQSAWIIDLFNSIKSLSDVESLNQYFISNIKTAVYISEKAISFDKVKHPDVLAGGAWMNFGFSHSDTWFVNPEELKDFEIAYDESRIIYKK